MLSVFQWVPGSLLALSSQSAREEGAVKGKRDCIGTEGAWAQGTGLGRGVGACGHTYQQRRAHTRMRTRSDAYIHTAAVISPAVAHERQWQRACLDSSLSFAGLISQCTLTRSLACLMLTLFRVRARALFKSHAPAAKTTGSFFRFSLTVYHVHSTLSPLHPPALSPALFSPPLSTPTSPNARKGH